jgi:hypothetical protein
LKTPGYYHAPLRGRALGGMEIGEAYSLVK